MTPANVKVLGFAAFSGTGKTTLLKQLIPLLKAKGLRVGLLKKTHHEVDIDHPGKDSYELRHAGACQVMLSSPRRRALITEHETLREHGLAEELGYFDWENIDLVLVEGYKHEPFPKIELHRPALGQPLLFPSDPSIIAVASDAPLPTRPNLPQFDLNDCATLAEFIFKRFHATD